MKERTRRELAFAIPIVKFALLFIAATSSYTLSLQVARWIAERQGSDRDELWHLQFFFGRIGALIGESLGAALLATVLAVAVGGIARFLARARIHDGRPDPLERVRRVVTMHPRATSLATFVPALLWLANLLSTPLASFDRAPWQAALPALLVPALLAFVVHVRLARRGLRAFLAPTLERMTTGPEGTELDAEGFSFRAVALTPYTFGAVGAMIALSLGTLWALLANRAPLLLDSTATQVGFLAYAVTAISGSFAFSRKSKVAIGLDGVLVGGTTKQRFVAFRDLEHARAIGDLIVLRSSRRTVLWLQLHGDDAGRRVALVERLNAAIARAKAHRDDPAAGFVEGATVAELTRAAHGAASYRQAAPTREKLWEIFESPVLAAEARRAAAEALASGVDAADRARFRVATDQIAEPQTRIRLQELLREGEREDEAEAPRVALALPLPQRLPM